MSELRDYQINAAERLDRAIKALYVLPTGGGKTIVATNLIERAVQRGERVLVLTHRREILRQTSLKLPIGHGMIQAGLNVDLEYPVQVASIQTLWARCMATDKIPLPAANLIIVDEAHHVAARTWRLILQEYPAARLIGLTATPCRSDGRGLGKFFDELIEGPQIPELIAAKYLVPTIYYAPAEPDLRGVESRQGDYVVNQLADRMNRDDLVGDIVSNWHKLGQRRKTLVFCVDVAHSVHVKDEFVKSGVRAEHLDGSTPKPERDAILTRLKSGETEVVCNCMVLTEGVDLPAIGCIMLARPTKQIGLAPRTRRTPRAAARKRRVSSNAANAVRYAKAASRVPPAASCPNAGPTQSSSARASLPASMQLAVRSKHPIRTKKCAGSPN
jgi:DNA repair protein RadD